MREIEFIIKLKLGSWPAQDKHKSIADSTVLLWEQIGECLSKFTISTELGKLNITIDWAPAILEVKNDYLHVFNHNEIPGSNYSEDWNDQIKGNCNLLGNTDDEVMPGTILDYIKNYFFHLFLVMNLSSPGSISLYNWEINFDGEEIKFEFDDSEFFGGWLSAIDNGWPIIQNISLSKSIEWLEKLNIGTKQIAQNRIERTLFALLHVASANEFTPSNLIWLAHCLEALFDTPNDSISRILRERIFLVLGVPEHNQRIIKNKIKEFYDFRSRFVHGNFDIHIPFMDETLDEDVETYIELIDESSAFAFSIVIATLQKMILEDWAEIQFYEAFNGKQNGV